MSDSHKQEDWDEAIPDTSLNSQENEEELQEEGEVLTPEEELQMELAKEKEKFLRLFAEFENYKKRTSKERVELFRTAGQEVIVALLPILDDFERAMKELAKSSDHESFKGVELIHNKLKETLRSKGLQEIGTKAGDAFDPDVHDAITQIPAPNKKMKGKIIDVVEKGFSLGDKIMRHPKVVVGN